MSDKKSAILRAAKGLTENYASEELFMPKSGRRLPNRSVIIDIVRDLKSIVFPGSVRIPVLPYFRSIMWDTD